MIEKVFIIGAGGFAAELTEYIKDNNLMTEKKVEIIGYFDIDDEQYNRYNFTSPFLGNERKYNFTKSDNIILAVGNPNLRKNILNYFLNVECSFYNFIHYSCKISSSSSIGIGNIFCPNIVVGPNAVIGSHNLFNYNTSVPHDTHVINNNIFSPYVQLTGFVEVGENNLFGTMVVVVPSIKIGNNNKIQAATLVDRNIKDGNLISTNHKKIKIPLYKD